MQTWVLAFKNLRFSILWTSSFVSGVGDAGVIITIVWMILSRTTNPFAVSLGLICLELPAIVSAPFLGPLLDRYQVANVSALINVVRATIFIIVGTVQTKTGLGWTEFFTLLAISSALAPLNKSVDNILLVNVVRKDQLIMANALMTIQFDLAFVIGPLVAGYLDSKGLYRMALYFNAATFIYAALSLLLLRNKVSTLEQTDVSSLNLRNEFQEWKNEFREGFFYIVRHGWIRNLVVLNFLWNFLIWGTAPTLLPLYSKYVLSIGAGGYGVLSAMTSIGIIGGSLLTGTYKTKENRIKIVFLAIACQGVVYAGIGLAHRPLLAALFLMFGGLLSAPSMIYYKTLLQVSIPKDKLGRVLMIMSAIGASGYPIGSLLSSWLARTAGNHNVNLGFIVFGSCITITATTIYVNAKSHNDFLNGAIEHENL